ncbi:TonB family protein [Bacteroidales bacterium OttesenSCG-928-M06]|nr:TonB family protein [Bacteroidales bacterium OttesenSCG-928-M06]
MNTSNLLFLRNKLSSIVISALLLFSFNSLSAQSERDADGDKTLSPYFVVLSENPEVDNLPLKETSVKANIIGVIADVTVKQVYVNSGQNTLEAIYTFPLSTKAAVYGMQMTIGSRIVTAKIEEKEKAREDYEKAKSEGKRASLLEQSRPNVFTMNVSNIIVGDTIVVELKYTELLVPEKGLYSFIYPTVVGPRYSNKSKQTAEVDDGFVATPYTKSGEEPSYDFNFELEVNTGIPIQNINSTTHKMNISHPELSKAIVKLSPEETKGGNKDVIVTYSLQGDKIESGLLLYEGEDENFFLMMVQPPKKVLKEDIPPREYIFIVDVSGSMHGFPLNVAKKLMRNLIVNLNPEDKFNVILFSLNTGIFSPNSVYATAENVERASRYIDSHDGGGDTQLIKALEDAYALPRPDADLSRTFVIVTDGYVDVEREAFELIRKNSGNTNVFSFGIGSGINRYLIEGMAFMGSGEPLVITEERGADKQAEAFRTYINTPALTQIKMNYGSFQAYDVEPVSIPDMLAERPVVVFGKYKGNPTGKITLSGKVGRKTYKQSFDLSKIGPDKENSAIRYLWARERIKLLDYYVSDYAEKGDKDVQTITQLGLKYNLMTNYTSFIAIDEQVVRDENGNLVTVKQALPLPEGVSDYAVGHEMGMLFGSSDGMDIAELEDYSVVEIEEIIVEEEEADEADEPFRFVEVMPEYPGGAEAMFKYISENISYPQEASENGIQGTVYVQFVVKEDGAISDIKVIRSVDKLLDDEAVRIVQLMPKFIPGKQNGKNVSVYYSLPIRFLLQ